MTITHRVKRVLITGMVFLLFLWHYSSVLAKTTVRVLEHAQVRSKLIRLGDISEIKGEDRLLVEKLQSIVLGKAPLPGETKEISGHYIKTKVRQNDFDASVVTLNLPEKIEVVSEAVEISSKKIDKIIKDFIIKRMPWDPEQISLKISAIKGIALATGNITYEVVPRKKEDYLGTTSFLLIFRVNGSIAKKLRVTAQIEVSKEVVLSNHPLKRHNIITKEDIRLKKMNLAGLPPDVITDPLKVIGKRTRRAIDPNTPLRLNFLEVLPLVKRGDLVIIIAETEVLKITTQGVVTENGVKGEMVRVINTGSRKEIYARVKDARTVEIDF